MWQWSNLINIQAVTMPLITKDQNILETILAAYAEIYNKPAWVNKNFNNSRHKIQKLGVVSVNLGSKDNAIIMIRFWFCHNLGFGERKLLCCCNALPETVNL